MAIQLSKLPFANDALQPHMSKETLDYHYGKHHAGYVSKLNKLIKGTNYDSMSLEDIVLESARKRDIKILHNAGQAWNHGFFWDCLTPARNQRPGSNTQEAIKQAFGAFDDFKKKFTEVAVDLFGSGWTWLIRKTDGKLAVEPMSDEGTPIMNGDIPLLTCDVWEHAYYIDYRNERPKFVESFWNVVNWDFVERNIELSETGREPFIRTQNTEIQPALQ